MKKSLLLYDVGAVLVFVIVGRSNHGAEESATGVLHTAGPFLIALVIGWAIMRAWEDPASLRTGIGVVAVTIAAGMLLRRFVFADGIEWTFVLVASAFLTLFLLGWRLGATWAGRHKTVEA